MFRVFSTYSRYGSTRGFLSNLKTGVISASSSSGSTSGFAQKCCGARVFLSNLKTGVISASSSSGFTSGFAQKCCRPVVTVGSGISFGFHMQYLKALPWSSQLQGSSTYSFDPSSYLKGTTNVCIQSFDMVFFAVDSLVSDAQGKAFPGLDLLKIFTFEHIPGMKNIMMMYSGCVYYPVKIRDKLWDHALKPGQLPDAASCAVYAQKYIEKAKALFLKNNHGVLPLEIAKLFSFVVSFASVGVNGPIVSVYNSGIGELNHNPGDFVQGHGSLMGQKYYREFYDLYFDGLQLHGDAFDRYTHDYNLFTIMDIMVECSKVKTEPSGGTIRIYKATPAGTALAWKGDIKLLCEKRARHWRAERENKAGSHEILSPIGVIGDY